MLGELGGRDRPRRVRCSSGVVGGHSLFSNHSPACPGGREEAALGGSASSGCHLGNRLAGEELGPESNAGVGGRGSDAQAFRVRGRLPRHVPSAPEETCRNCSEHCGHAVPIPAGVGEACSRAPLRRGPWPRIVVLSSPDLPTPPQPQRLLEPDLTQPSEWPPPRGILVWRPSRPQPLRRFCPVSAGYLWPPRAV